MTHQAATSEESDTLELIETEKPSEDKLRKLTKDVLGLKTERDLILHNHIPEIVEKLESTSDSLLVLREDHAETNRLVRKMFYEMIPSLHNKVDNLTIKVNDLTNKVDLLCSKLEKHFE